MKRWTIKDVWNHWDSVPQYDDINAKIDSYFRRFTDSAPLFTIPENAKVLDIECRTANGTAYFHKKYPTAQFTCVAMAPSFVNRAKQKLESENMKPDVSLLEELPLKFEDASFDVVLSFETLEHMPDPAAFIAELGRLTKPGGMLVLTTPNVLWEPVHWFSATFHLDHGEGPHRMVPRGEIKKAFSNAGFEITKEKTFVLVPAGPKFLLRFGKWLEKIMPERLLRTLALRRTFICKKTDDIWWHKIKTEIVDTGLETQCGTCVGLSNGTLDYKEIRGIPTLTRTDKKDPVPRIAYEACAAKDCNYPKLNAFVFNELPKNWLSGVVEQAYVGHASDEAIRRAGASGGVITATIIYLLESGKIDGAICLRLGKTVPYKAEPVIAHTKEEIIACAQSIYSVTPVNTILSTLSAAETPTSPLAYIGLPDQVAAIRKLQMMDHPSVRNIKYIFGPYTGTQMYFEAIRSFLRSHGIKSEEEIVDLKYRAGEWPGYLQIKLKDGRMLKAEKFHYNYLIPFFITQSSLQIPDFTNELTDISVGDAWSPKYEKERGGHSVILARSKKGAELLEEMRNQKLITIEPKTQNEVLDMHGHMLDFKKRGSFIRNKWRRVQPDYGYEPAHIPASRIAVEWCLRAFFAIGKLKSARWTVEHVPIKIVGPIFNALRKSWKAVSKPTKRKGLKEVTFSILNS